MANHKSALKRVRSDATKRERNRYQHKTTRNAIRDLRANDNKKDAEKRLPEVISMVDKLAKKNILEKYILIYFETCKFFRQQIFYILQSDVAAQKPFHQ